MSDLNFSEDYGYTREHEWTSLPAGEMAGQRVKIGITEVATEALGDIVFLELPEVGDEVSAGEPCGEVESTKSVSQIFSPVSGTVTAVNDEAVDDPAVVNEDPYGRGWLYEVEVTEVGEILTAAQYSALD